MTEAEAIQIAGMFISAFPNTPADDGTIDLWVTALAFVDVHDGRRVAMELVNTHKFFPTIAEFNDILNGYKRRRDLENGGRREIGGGAIVSHTEGMRIAKAAYIGERRLQGREPTPSMLAMFDKGLLGGVRVGAS